MTRQGSAGAHSLILSCGPHFPFLSFLLQTKVWLSLSFLLHWLHSTSWGKYWTSSPEASLKQPHLWRRPPVSNDQVNISLFDEEWKVMKIFREFSFNPISPDFRVPSVSFYKLNSYPTPPVSSLIRLSSSMDLSRSQAVKVMKIKIKFLTTANKINCFLLKRINIFTYTVSVELAIQNHSMHILPLFEGLV